VTELAAGVPDLLAPYGLELVEAVAAATGDEFSRLISKYPGLLSTPVLQALHAEAKKTGRSSLVETVELLDVGATQLDEDRGEYPLGLGPIETSAAKVEGREIAFEVALAEVREPVVRLTVTPLYAGALMRRAIAEANEGNWRHALTLARLTVAAADAAGIEGERGEARTQAALDFLIVALPVLGRVPDGRLLGEARELAARASAEAVASGDRTALGQADYRVGGLLLEPVRSYGTVNQARFDSRWEEILRQEYGPSFQFHKEDFRLPPLTELLELAEGHYRRSLEFRDGHLRGIAGAALLQTLELRRRAGVTIDEVELERIARTALEEIDRDQAPQHYLDVLSILGEREEDHEQPRDAGDRPSADESFEAVIARARTLAPHEPGAGLIELAELDIRIRDAGSEEQRNIAADTFLQLVPKAWAPEDVPPFLSERTQQLGARAEREGWTADRVAAAAVASASRSGEQDAERDAISLLGELDSFAPAFVMMHMDALRIIVARLWMDAGSTALKTSDVAGAVECYVNGLWGFVELGFPRAAASALHRITELVGGGDPDAAASAIAGIAERVGELDLLLGPASESDLQELVKCAIAAFSDATYGLEGVLIARQIAKGRRFATALARGPTNEIIDEDGRRLLALVEESQAMVATETPAALFDDIADWFESTRLLAYAGVDEAAGGGALLERFANRRCAFDQYLEQRMLSAGALHYLTEQDIRQALDERTILLDFYLGRSPDAALTVYVLLFTRDRTRVAAIRNVQAPEGEVYLGGEHGQPRLHVHPMSLVIADLRDELVADPGFEGNLSDAAAERLERDVNALIGPAIVDLLEEELGRGRDHLCIVPHGPLHYHPMHLIGPREQPLAERFIVTFLPNLQLLSRPVDSRRSSAAAIGMTFMTSNRYHVRELPQAAEEAASIANVYGIDPLLDDAATEPAVFEALATARVVHFFTHGTHDIIAPAFQCLYVAPGETSDGRVAAHELLGLDMTGLDLVTMSACETALGRFDRSDNLRGLPAAFFLAGVSTVIGTLWETDAAASAWFFRNLHTSLHDGLTKLDAFGAAQRTTRQAFPAYRDWGPFYMMGHWR
jgi:hypothetical protein